MVTTFYTLVRILSILFSGVALIIIICPPLCKGRWIAKQDGGVVKTPQKQSLTRLRRELPLHKGAFGMVRTYHVAVGVSLSSQASLRREEATKWQEGECVQNKIIVYFEATQSPPPDSVGSSLYTREPLVWCEHTA